MQHLGEHPGRVEDTRAGSVEIQVAVGDEHATRAHGSKTTPSGTFGQHGHLADRTIEPEPARRNDEDIGIGRAYIIPGDRRRMRRT